MGFVSRHLPSPDIIAKLSPTVCSVLFWGPFKGDANRSDTDEDKTSTNFEEEFEKLKELHASGKERGLAGWGSEGLHFPPEGKDQSSEQPGQVERLTSGGHQRKQEDQDFTACFSFSFPKKCCIVAQRNGHLFVQRGRGSPPWAEGWTTEVASEHLQLWISLPRDC